jgi:NAD(P)-dependent dehydrogenase (short-subunit alcohol dehydrogenase family)
MSKVWLITGSSRGLGRAVAEAVAASGDELVATARDVKSLAGLRGEHVALDVTDPDAARAAVAAAVERFGRLDVVVNNAGYADLGSIEEMPPEVFDAQIATNFFGVVNVTRAALPVLRAQRSGHFIQVSTAGGRNAYPGQSAYHASKFAVEGFSESLAKEVAPLGVKVTIVEPGGFRTDWAGSSMRTYPAHEDYAESVGAMMALIHGNGHSPVGDPAKAARVIVQVAAMDEPPLRLPLGSDASALIRAGDEARIAEIDRWRELSLSTDADDAVPFDPAVLPG